MSKKFIYIFVTALLIQIPAFADDKLDEDKYTDEKLDKSEYTD